MNARELQKNGKLYRLDAELLAAHRNAVRLTGLIGETAETEGERRRELIRELFAEVGEGVWIDPPFHCDYGINTHIGKHFYCNYDCAFLDCGQIVIGDDVMFGPKVGLYAVNHPIDPAVRATGVEYGRPITIGSRVWIGGGTTVCPGVTIGDDVVIGAGSVVVKDIPSGVVAAGNPCRVIRKVTEEDTKYWQEEIALARALSDDPALF